MLNLNKPNVDKRTETQISQLLTSKFLEYLGLSEFSPTSVLHQMAVAFAYFIRLIQFKANQSVQSLKQTFMSFLGLTKQEATKATCTLTITLFDPTDIEYTIPAGALVKAATDPIIIYETTQDLTFAVGEQTKTVAAQALLSGSSSRVQAGQLTLQQTPLSYVDSITNTTSSGGLDDETDEQATTRLQGVLGSYYVANTPDSFESLVEQVQGVYRSKCYPNTHPTNSKINDPGFTTVVIYPTAGDGDQALIDAVNTYLNDKHILGWPIYTILPLWQTIDIDIKVRKSNISDNTLTSNITTKLNELFKDWTWETALTLSALRSALLEVEGVVSVAFNTPADDIELGQFGMPKLGTLTVESWT